MLTADQVICLLALEPLPEEGGYFRRTYRLAAPDGFGVPLGDGGTLLASAIYYLIRPDAFSALHRLPGDEIFHHYLGDPVEQLRLGPDGSGRIVIIGPDLVAGQRPQAVVPGGVWQGTRLLPGGPHGYALLGTTMAPGFVEAGYEGGRRDALSAAYPKYRALIAALTRQDEKN